ncbi:ATP-binding protein [Allokutzneria sp. A3M-2-11 16]|uniref:sensor histidine kinase n=1 Tax=Allokutzneria sp. A3M-2-11 16 TaxID=2962043 RepID=UPI0020B75D31|nr:sensor histidine kinase [Allokutzneria sp. A3M-2-11 16]MCP3798485.1 ATP-binding protein [Allokutzneria sp. A3M-2-11 16]
MSHRFGSLRGRLLATILVLTTLSIVAVDIAALLSMRAYLQSRVDTVLTSLDQRIRELDARNLPPASESLRTLRSLGPSGNYVALVGRGGVVLDSAPADGPSGAPEPAPVLSKELLSGRALVTVPSVAEDGPGYRVLVSPLVEPVHLWGQQDPRELVAVVIATSLRPNEDALTKLAVFVAVATLIAVAAVGALSLGALRVGLKPLRDMATTASAIATGDTARRVELTDAGREVEQLADAINRAFDAREHSEQRLRSFVADASHELRTPLTTIRGWAELYLQDIDDPALLELAMSRISDESLRMHALVEELLLLARLDQGRPLDRELVDLARLAAEAVADSRIIDPARDITLDLSTVDSIVPGDADRLRQVLRNLLGNALQHTPAGLPVHVSVRPVGDKAVALSVADEGPGLDPALAGRVFERFYRGDRSRGPGGSGLGLSIVKAITEVHGGSARVESVPGAGATFVVTLPRRS